MAADKIRFQAETFCLSVDISFYASNVRKDAVVVHISAKLFQISTIAGHMSAKEQLITIAEVIVNRGDRYIDDRFLSGQRQCFFILIKGHDL